MKGTSLYMVQNLQRLWVQPCVICKSGREVLDTQLLFSIRLYCYGAVGMTREWVLEDNVTSPETLVQMMFASMPDQLRQIYFPG